MLLSIVIPVYNTGKYLDKLLKSVETQLTDDMEVIFVDDDSTDDSCTQIQIAAEKYSNIYLYTQEHLGAPAARNLGITYAKGEFIYFFDSDDWFENNILTKITSCLGDTTADLLIGNGYVVSEQGAVMGDKFSGLTDGSSKEMEPLYFVDSNPGNKIFRKSVIDRYHIVFDDVKIHQDLNFYLKYLLHCHEVQYIQDYMYYYLVRQDSIAHKVTTGIADAVKSMQCVYEYYQQNNCYEQYREILEFNMVKNICFQLDKIIYLDTAAERKQVSDLFEQELQKIDLEKNPYIQNQHRQSIAGFLREKDILTQETPDLKQLKELLTKDYEKQLSRLKNDFNITSRWLSLKLSQRELTEYFQRHHYKKIAIYGMGQIGKMLYQDLRNTSLEFAGFIDQNAGQTHFATEEIPVCRVEEIDDLQTDCIVISLVHIKELVEANIRAVREDIAICPLDQILDEVLK